MRASLWLHALVWFGDHAAGLFPSKPDIALANTPRVRLAPVAAARLGSREVRPRPMAARDRAVRVGRSRVQVQPGENRQDHLI
jgi:hypothetical protein